MRLFLTILLIFVAYFIFVKTPFLMGLTGVAFVLLGPGFLLLLAAAVLALRRGKPSGARRDSRYQWNGGQVQQEFEEDMRDINELLRRMEERIEALETILLDQDAGAQRRHGNS